MISPTMSRALAQAVNRDRPAPEAMLKVWDAARQAGSDREFAAAVARLLPGLGGGPKAAAGTSAAQAAGAIPYAGRGAAAAVMERLHAAYPAGYRQALNTTPPPGTYAQVGAGRLVTVMPQPYPERVDGYRAQLRNGADLGPSMALRHEGRLCLVDGTHRAVARVLEGRRDLPVHIIDPAPAPAASGDEADDCYVDVTALFDADAAAFEEAEHPRGWHGRFGHGTRPGGPAAPAPAGAPPRVRNLADLAERASRLGVRQRVGYKGHDLDRTANKGYRVRLTTGEVQHYDHPHDAARAVFEVKHFNPRDVPEAKLQERAGNGDVGAADELIRRGKTPKGKPQPKEPGLSSSDIMDRIKMLPVGQARDINGARVERLPATTGRRYSITIGGRTETYANSHLAALAVHQRTHDPKPQRIEPPPEPEHPATVKELIRWSKEFGASGITVTRDQQVAGLWEVRGLPPESGFGGGMKLLNETQIAAIARKLRTQHQHLQDIGVRSKPEAPQPKAVTDLISAYNRAGYDITVTKYTEAGFWEVRGLPGYGNVAQLLSEDRMAALARKVPKPKPGTDPAAGLSAKPAKPGLLSPLALHFLQEYRDAGGPLTGFDVKDRDDPLTIKQLGQYAKVPPEIRQRLAAEGVELYFGTRPITELDDLRSLAGKQPSGYSKGQTFSKVAAVMSWMGPTEHNSRYHPVVAIGGGKRTYGTGSVNVSAHEAGHAMDYSLGRISEQAGFRTLHEQAKGKFGKFMRPYYIQRDNPDSGRREFLAETFAAWSNGKAEGDPPDLIAQNIMRAVGAWPHGGGALDPRLDEAETLGAALRDYYAKLHADIKANPGRGLKGMSVQELFSLVTNKDDESAKKELERRGIKPPAKRKPTGGRR